MKPYRPAPRLEVCAFLAALCDVAGQALGREKYIAEMVDLIVGGVS